MDEIRFINNDPLTNLYGKYNDDIRENIRYIDNEIVKLLINNDKIEQKDLDNLILNCLGDAKIGFFPTYGEITSPINIILDELEINDKDIVYDLGSGEGKFCIDVWKETGIKCIGIEYLKERYDISINKVKHLGERPIFIHGNFLDYSWDDASIIYMCSTCYDNITISKIVDKSLGEAPNLKYIISLKEILNKYNNFFDMKIIKINVTWKDDNVNCYIYKIKNRFN